MASYARFSPEAEYSKSWNGAVSIRHPLFRQNQNGTRAVQISDTLLGGAQMISDTLLVGAQMSRGLLLVGA